MNSTLVAVWITLPPANAHFPDKASDDGAMHQVDFLKVVLCRENTDARPHGGLRSESDRSTMEQMAGQILQRCAARASRGEFQREKSMKINGLVDGT